MLEWVYRHEQERPDQIWLTQPVGAGQVRTFTWGQALAEARRMATHLQAFPRGSRIAILSKNCAHFLLSDLAIWMAGHVSVALYPTLSAESIRYILDHSESSLLFVGKLDGWEAQRSALPAGLPGIAYPLAPPTGLPNWDDLIATTAPLAGQPTRDPQDTGCLLYTSGSTGTAKGVEHTFQSMGASAAVVSELLRVGPEDRMISYLPLAHAFERCVVEMLSLRSGLQVFFAESLDTFVEDLRRARPTIFHSVPRLWLKFQLGVLSKMPERKLRLLTRVPFLSTFVKRKVLAGLGLDQTRIAITGSAPIPPALIAWYRELGLELLEGYAMTEDFVYSHLSLPGRTRVGYVGHVLPGAQARISPEGEVLLKSPGNMKGYYKDPELTAASYTEDGFFKTGDRGEYDDQGRLRITGRVKELFKSAKGKYIAPAPIENLLNAHGHIELSCVTGAGLPQPLALLQLAEALRRDLRQARDSLGGTLRALMAQVNEQLDEWERLCCLVVIGREWQIENGFLTPTMKIKRNRIDEHYSGCFETWASSPEPVIWHQEAH